MFTLNENIAAARIGKDETPAGRRLQHRVCPNLVRARSSAC